jgi:hypothetical protein
MAEQDNGDDDDGPDRFTPGQRRQLLKMLETHKRAAWLWSSVGIWAKWFVSVAAAVAVLKAALMGYFKGTAP